MNINVISTQVMLAHSHMWTRNPAVVEELSAHPLGAAILGEVKRVHLLLADTQDRRAEIRKALRRISELLAALDARHDSLSRAIYFHLQAFVQAARSPEQARQYVDLLDLLFPTGLQVIRLSYLGEAGAMIERVQRVTQSMLALMADIRVGDCSLLDLYYEWNSVAEELGAKAQEQARMRASLTRQGTAVTAKDALAARHEWIAVVSALLVNLAFIPLSDRAREMLLGPLTQSIQDSLSRRTSGDAAESEGNHETQGDEIHKEDGEIHEENDDDELDDAAARTNGTAAEVTTSSPAIQPNADFADQPNAALADIRGTDRGGSTNSPPTTRTTAVRPLLGSLPRPRIARVPVTAGGIRPSPERRARTGSPQSQQRPRQRPKPSMLSSLLYGRSRYRSILKTARSTA